MKRIDEKIKEIEKKDKRNRILYIVIFLMIAAFMATVLVYESVVKETKDQLSKAEVEKSQFYQDLLKEKEISESRFDSLEMSLRPEDYWAYISNQNSTEAYINYLTNIWGIKRDKIDKAIDNLESLEGSEVLRGWIYIGKIVGDEYTDKRVSVVWRKGDPVVDPGAIPQKGDIIQYNSAVNRKTYYSKSLSGNSNGKGWRAKTKAYVLEVYQDGAELKARVQYY